MEHLILDQMGGKRVEKEEGRGSVTAFNRPRQPKPAGMHRLAARAACTGMQTRGLSRVFNLIST